MISLLILLLVVGQNDPIYTSYKDAIGLFSEGQYKQAKRIFKLLRRDAKRDFDTELRLRTAECLFNMGDVSGAERELQGINIRDSSSYVTPEVLLALGYVYLREGKTEEAERKFKRVLHFPEYAEEERVRFGLALLNYKRGNYEPAFSELANLNSYRAKLLKAKTLIYLKRPMESLKILKTLEEEREDTLSTSLILFTMGEALFLYRDFTGAELKLREFIERYPDTPLSSYARYFLGASLLNQNRTREARRHLLLSLRDERESIAAHSAYLIGISYFKEAQFDTALLWFQKVKAHFPSSPVVDKVLFKTIETELVAKREDKEVVISTVSQLKDILETGEMPGMGDYFSGVLYLSTDNYQEAKRAFSRVFSLYSGSPFREPAMVGFVLSASRIGEYELAGQTALSYLRDFPEDTSKWRTYLYYYLAELLSKTDRVEDAIPYYTYVINNSWNPELSLYARCGLGWAELKRGLYDSAIRDFDIVLKEDISDRLLLFTQWGRGIAYFNKGDYLKSAEILSSIKDNFPKEERIAPLLMFDAGVAFYESGYYLQAIKTWEELVSRHPSSPLSIEAALKAGDTYFKAQEYEKAIELFGVVLDKSEDSEEAKRAQLFIAQSFYNLHRDKDAITHYRKFIERFPDDPRRKDAENGIAMSLYRLGVEDESSWEELIDEYRGSEFAAQAQFRIANTLFEEGDYLEAAHNFEKVVVNFPESPLAEKALLLEAECYTNLEDKESSMKTYKKFIDYFPSSEDIPLVRYNLSIIYLNLEKYEEAVGELYLLLKENIDKEMKLKALSSLTFALSKLGREEGILSILSDFKGDMDTRTVVYAAKILKDRGRYNSVIELLKTMRTDDAELQAEIISTLGESYLAIGEEGKAISIFRKIIGLRIIDNYYKLQVLAHLAEIYEKRAQLDEAIAVYKEMKRSTTNNKIKAMTDEKIRLLEKTKLG